MEIHLGVGAELTLKYELFDNPVSKLIFEKMQKQKNILINRTIFCAFGETEEKLTQELHQTIIELKKYVPLKNYESIDDLNILHENFPNFHREYSDNPIVFKLLREFNTKIHHLEHLQRSSNPHFQFACEDEHLFPMQDDWYSLFTPSKKKGYMYMHYPHVGKHFMELWRDGDVDIPEEHIVFTSIIANTFSFWFGSDDYTTEEELSSLYCELEQFHKKISHKIPYEWGDPRLAIGYIPLGKIVGDPDELINRISDHKYVHSWDVYK